MIDGPLIDAHVHVVDFLQDAADPTDLLAALDEGGVDGAVVFGLPVKKKWGDHEPHRPRYYLDDSDSCYPWSATDGATARFVERADAPERLAPLACGVDPTDLDAARHIDALLTHGPFVGVGELLLRHGRLSTLIHREPARANHPAILAVADVCAHHDAPLLIHQNAGSDGQGPTAYLPELEALLDHRPEVDVVWAHAGVSGEGAAPPAQRVSELLDRHPRLHVDISWAATEVIEPGDHVATDWLEVVSAHPDRFLWGSDCVGRFDGLPGIAARMADFCAQLPATARDAVRGGNARRIFFDRP